MGGREYMLAGTMRMVQEICEFQRIKILYGPKSGDMFFEVFVYCDDGTNWYYPFGKDEMGFYRIIIDGMDYTGNITEIHALVHHKNDGEFLKDKEICDAIRQVKYAFKF